MELSYRRGSVRCVDDALGQLEAATAELGQRALFGLGDAELAAALTRLADVRTRLVGVQAWCARQTVAACRPIWVTRRRQCGCASSCAARHPRPSSWSRWADCSTPARRSARRS